LLWYNNNNNNNNNRCVHYGVLPNSEAKRLFKEVTERKKNARLGITSPSPVKKKKVKKSKVLKEEGHDPDLAVSGGDGIGTATL